MVKYRQNVEERLILILQEEKIINDDYQEEYLTNISNKILLWQY